MQDDSRPAPHQTPHSLMRLHRPPPVPGRSPERPSAAAGGDPARFLVTLASEAALAILGLVRALRRLR